MRFSPSAKPPFARLLLPALRLDRIGLTPPPFPTRMPPFPLSHFLGHCIPTSPAVVRRTTRLFLTSLSTTTLPLPLPLPPRRSSSQPPLHLLSTQTHPHPSTKILPHLLPEWGGGGGGGFRAWLQGGAQYRRGIKGATNWIGETVRSRPPPPPILVRIFLPRSLITFPPNSPSRLIQLLNPYLPSANSSKPKSTTPTWVTYKPTPRLRTSSSFELSLPNSDFQWLENVVFTSRQGMESHLGVKTLNEQSGSNWRGIERSEQGQRVEQIRTEGKAGWEMLDEENGERPVFLPLLQHLSTSTTNVEAGQEPTPLAAAENVPKKSLSQIKIVEPGNKLAKTYNSKKTKRGNRKRPVGTE
ncbi:BQ5605_C077g12949 [Microbotryum silenes-dioicae]|uniref:BQ5605_C077g12949 protein n=1 Tax=Microbotryum silenes-dioicae TaxID=796604 RepID=A0A2X0MRH2_9BASI|nr:BQ5605_C077g12949 [Microbotryum silenes-dioicae]